MTEILIIAGAIIVVILLTIIAILSRYKKCKSDEILVVFGKTSEDTPAKIYHGGGAFIWPVIQDYRTMSMTPLQLQVKVEGVSSQMIKVSIPVILTTAIATEKEIMQNAATRFLSTDPVDIQKQLQEILVGEMRSLMATMTIEDITANRDAFIMTAKKSLEAELSKVGFKIININTSDVDDNADYIKNLGKKSATQARATAEADIAEQEKLGAIKMAITKQERDIQIANAEKARAVTVAQTEQEREINVAAITKEKEIRLAEAEKEQQSGIAEQQAEKISRIAESQSKADSAKAEFQSLATAKVAVAEADARAAEEEAKAKQEIRIANATQEQAAETAKAMQEAKAKTAEFESAQKQRAAEAAKKAGVAEQITTIEVSEAKAKAEKAKADAVKVAGVANVEAQMATEKIKQERQIEVNEATAKAKEAQLKADIIVPAETAKQKATLDAEAEKAKITIAAQAKASAIQVEAEAEAKKIEVITSAEAEGVRKNLMAEADGKRASLMAEADKIQAIEMAPALAIQHMIANGMTPSMIVEWKTVDQLKEIAEASAKVYENIHLGNITVYGDENLAGKFMSSTAKNLNPALDLLSSIPIRSKLKQIFGKGEKELPVVANVVNKEVETKDDFEEVK